MDSPCAICDKHRGIGALAGPVIYDNDLIVVSHRPVAARTEVPGYLFVETRRHVSGLSRLTEAEAAAVSRAAWVGAKALDAELRPEFVFTLVAGLSVAHFHQHLFVRPFGTPEEIAWNDVDSWADAPRIEQEEMARLCESLRAHFPSN